MDSEALELAVTDYALGVLLRYFRSISAVNLNRPLLAIERDREMLRLHWAISPVVNVLVSYVLVHHHEIQTVLGSQVRVEDGIVRGRIDAIATMRARRVSGLPTTIVSHEPKRSYTSGPNHVLGWVLAQAWSLASRFSKLTLDSPSYLSVIDASLQRLEQSRRLQAIAQITGQPSVARRPTVNAVTEAARSRLMIYQLATAAYKSLLEIEAGDINAISAMLRQTLLGPLEPWRRFELAIGLSVAEALSSSERVPMTLNLMIGDSRRQIASVGRFDIVWQSLTKHYSAPLPEPSERVVQSILEAYGLGSSGDRPDLVIANRTLGQVSAIVEVKYLTGEDASDRIRGAVSQLVRYSRGYQPLESSALLLGSSLVAVSQGVDGLSIPDDLPTGTPRVLSFEQIKRGSLASWSKHLSEGSV